MSRDMTPAEVYLFDKSTGGKVRSSTVTWKLMNGEKFTVGNTGEAYERFPELTFLLKGFRNFYEEVKTSVPAMRVLERVEDYVKASEYNLHPDTGIISPDGTALDAAVRKWFNGRLDKNFYESDENHRLMLEAIKAAVSEAEKNPVPIDRTIMIE